jgi:hypothetical protein
MTFQRALGLSPKGKRHLLLGNGFSRAWKDAVFSYDALLNRAKFESLSPKAREAFDVLKTSDFETVMRALEAAYTLVQLYAPTRTNLAKTLRSDARGLRDVLVEVIAGHHPDRPADVRGAEYLCAREFLGHFKDIYTLNYDLLLYWTMMQEELPPEMRCDDGFRTPDEGPQKYVTWDVEKTDGQNIFYLHGALHLFDGGHEMKKFTWSNTGIALMDQIRAALEQRMFPLFVAEGESKSKLRKIKHNDYLSRGYRSFAKIGGPLFVYGHSMGPADAHIARLIEKNKCSDLFVGLHGNPDSDGNQRIAKKCLALAAARPERHPLRVRYFDSASAHVWRK